MRRNLKYLEIISMMLVVLLISIGCDKTNTPSPPKMTQPSMSSISISEASNRKEITANGTSTATIVVTVYENTNKLAADMTEVVFKTTHGTFVNGTDTITAKTVNGSAQATI